MNLHVRYRQLEPSTELRRLVARRAHFALSRFTHSIRAVHVTLSDVNGPRGGVDKRCQVEVTGPGRASIVVEDVAADLTAAIDAAMGRVARTTARQLGRRRLLAPRA